VVVSPNGGLKVLEEFKKFALRGNVVDLAVGVIIGAAFGAIVASLVADIIMPIIGAVTGGLDFSNYYIPLSSKVTAGLAYADAKKAGAVLGYGQFITVAINFLIVAFVLFLVIRGINMMTARNRKEQAEAVPPPPPEEVVLLGQIRDQLSSLNTNMSKKA
jgi:large conductance mechanosensitive channel